MRLLADENIPASVIRILRDDGHDIIGVRDHAPGIPDLEVMRFAHKENRIILTCDKDFGELAVRDTTNPCWGIILLRIPLKDPHWIAGYLRDVIHSRQDWEGHFSVIEEQKIRMRSLSYR